MYNFADEFLLIRNQKYLFANVLSRFLEHPSFSGGNVDPISTCMPEYILKDTKIYCFNFISLSLFHVIGLTAQRNGRRRRLVDQWTV